ncbi:Ti-type conjugative transfer relaxase TraA [Acidiphilium acidophilum]|uniref:Ti-type conjugative transfer relaxase TraA n=1 Tax=Acidiphilium acidophilum TaxID=76588 RepID=UPI002E8E72BC|nr:Ti-type conjugative transfer relaxase TraA [Acidiphilium acidophilum]
MAIYHLSMKPIARSSGRSAVAAAAYRAGVSLENARDGMTHDFTRRSGVEHAEIVLPGDTVGADGSVVQGSGPAWARDRSALWNAAEASEKRKDARVAREIEVALPHELSADQRLALTREFSQALAKQYGVAVDFAVHSPHGQTDIRNHHAHILMTTRQIGAAQVTGPEGGLGDKSVLELENKKLVALGLPTSHEQLRDIRIGWEQRTNAHLAQAGLDVRIDHRSHQECGLEIEPTQHVGVHATQMARRGLEVSRVRLDDEAAQRNAALIREKPEQVLTLITNEKSVFDRRDIARTLHRYLDGAGPGGAEAFHTALTKVMVSPALVELQAEQRDERGQVIESARYSTRELVGIEREMAASADRMAADRGGLAGQGFAVAPRHVDAALERQDGSIRRAGGDGLADEQRAAIAHITGPERIAATVGLAGAGKSTMLAAAREAWGAQGFQVHGAALAGKAAEGLEESSGIVSRTLASWSRGWERGFDQLGPSSVFVIDEAGMVGSKQLSRFITEADRAGAKIVLVGDPEQLQPIGAGAAFRAVAERIGCVELEGVRRQRDGWQRAASVDFGRHRTVEGLAAYAQRGGVRFEATGEDARGAIVRDLMADRAARPEGSRLVLAHRRADVQGLNEAIRAARQMQGELTGEIVYRTTEGARAFAPGDRIMFRENNRDLGVKNGMLGTVECAKEGHLSVRLDNTAGAGSGRASAGHASAGRTVLVSMADYAAVDHGYATTIHKSQGATVDRAFVLASGTMDRHLTYVAMTRHRDGVTLYAGRDEFSDIGALSGRLSRSQAKETTLDYDRPTEAPAAGWQRGVGGFGARRGIEERGAIETPAMIRDRAAAPVQVQAQAPAEVEAQAPDRSGAQDGAGFWQAAIESGRQIGANQRAERAGLAAWRSASEPDTARPDTVEDQARAAERQALRAALGQDKEAPVVAQDRAGDRPAARAAEPAAEAPPARKRGMFDGLKLGTDRARPSIAPGAFAGMSLPVPARGPVQPAPASLGVAPNGLNRAVERYARAWTDEARMRAQELPLLEHQKIALRDTGAALDAARPGSVQDLRYALHYDPKTRQAMTDLTGPARSAALVSGMEHEAKRRADPNVRAQRYAATWKGLEAAHNKNDAWDKAPFRDAIAERLQKVATMVQQDGPAQAVMVAQPARFGITPGSLFMQIIQGRNIGQIAARLVSQSISADLDIGQSLERSRSAGHDHGMSM